MQLVVAALGQLPGQDMLCSNSHSHEQDKGSYSVPQWWKSHRMKATLQKMYLQCLKQNEDFQGGGAVTDLYSVVVRAMREVLNRLSAKKCAMWPASFG